MAEAVTKRKGRGKNVGESEEVICTVGYDGGDAVEEDRSVHDSDADRQYCAADVQYGGFHRRWPVCRG